MLKKTIKYTDYNGREIEGDFYFHLNKAEISEMEMSIKGGLAEMIKMIIKTEDTPALIKIFKDLILKSYGEKSLDGLHFRKFDRDGYRLADDFAQTEAYSVLFMELATDSDAAAKFINGIMPDDLVREAAKAIENK